MVSLGLVKVPNPGTPVQLNGGTSQPCNSVNVQPMHGPTTPNTGNLYVGVAGMSKATLVGVLYVLAPGQPATTVSPKSKGALKDDVSTYWLDADNANDAGLVSYA